MEKKWCLQHRMMVDMPFVTVDEFDTKEEAEAVMNGFVNTIPAYANLYRVK